MQRALYQNFVVCHCLYMMPCFSSVAFDRLVRWWIELLTFLYILTGIVCATTGTIFMAVKRLQPRASIRVRRQTFKKILLINASHQAYETDTCTVYIHSIIINGQVLVF